MIRSILIGAVAAAAVNATASAQSIARPDVAAIDFPTTCNAAASAHIPQAVAELHHMMYGNARDLFRAASAADTSCAIALWGIAMTYIHPLWPDRPSAADLAEGRALTSRAIALDAGDAREAAYVSTTSAYFDNTQSLTESERLASFEAAWLGVRAGNPDDREAALFYALAQLATVDQRDKTYTKQMRAGALAEEVLAAVPAHPGAHHYIIHAYDYPGLAERALGVARNYGRVAPAVPHALHMMSHIFTRLGLWDESIEWNRRSADAAWQLSEQIGAISIHYQHAMDYLAYAYLQKGQDQLALDVVETMASLNAPFDSVNRDAQAYAFAAAPARYALERRDWARAANLQTQVPRAFPWEDAHLQYVALTRFARGLGLAHLNRLDQAATEAAALADIQERIASSSPYWATQVTILELGLRAWIAYLDHDTERGERLMQQAAEIEASTEKSPVTPGEVLPAMELLGDMLSRSGRYDRALAAYVAALGRSPLRLNSLYGAAQAAENNGQPARANDYYQRIAAIADRESTRPSIVHAREAAN